MYTEDIDYALDSGYNNVGELLGVGLGATDHELMGALEGLDPLKRFQVMKKLFTGTRISRGSRADMEKNFKTLPKHIKQQLLKGNLRLADWSIYTIKPLSSKTVKLFEPQDVKEIGLRNVSDAKLPKNQVITISGIRLLAGIAEDKTDKEMLKATPFGSVSKIAALANGEFHLKANRKQIVPENTPIRKMFVTDNNHTINLGYYRLDNPRPINDEELIEATIELGTMHGVDKNAVIWAELDGTITTP